MQARLRLDQRRAHVPAQPARDAPRTALYRRRVAVERELGRLKHDWALAPLHVRGLDRIRPHTDLTILAKPARLRAQSCASRTPAA